MSNFTTVIGVDKSHLEKLKLTWPTWLRYKPSTILDHPLVVFYDADQLTVRDVHEVVKDHTQTIIYPWPPSIVVHGGVPGDRWEDPQRYRMLSGFVHVPPKTVNTDYWLKLDVDTVATGNDNWIDETWFDEEPAIISAPWGYTKPAGQMKYLDTWMEVHKDLLPAFANITPPLNLIPNPGSSLVKHKRIISWCGFFNTGFTNVCSQAAKMICGEGKLPVPSQDGFMFYMAKRGDLGIKTPNMKKLGWSHCGSMKSIQNEVDRVMGVPCAQ